MTDSENWDFEPDTKSTIEAATEPDARPKSDTQPTIALDTKPDGKGNEASSIIRY